MPHDIRRLLAISALTAMTFAAPALADDWGHLRQGLG
jgi:hypothetical protein